MTLALYPLFLKLQDRACIVVGGNDLAEGKIRGLLDAGAKVRVIAAYVTDAIVSWSREGRLQWQPRAYATGDLHDAFLVIAVCDPETNATVLQEAEREKIFCNAVDDGEHCSCYAGAVVQRGPLQIAISTSGYSPALAQRLRHQLEQQFGPEYEAWVENLGAARSWIFQDDSIDAETRRRLLHEMAGPTAFDAFRRSLAQRGGAQAHKAKTDSETES